VFYVNSALWFVGSIAAAFVILALNQRGNNNPISKLLAFILILISLEMAGWSRGHLGQEKLYVLRNIDLLIILITVIVWLTALYNIYSSKASSEISRSSTSTGWFSWRETVQYQILDPGDARARGYLKILVVLIIHQILNIANVLAFWVTTKSV
jgi:heme A synthase